MLPRVVEYARPASLEEALELLGSSDGVRALAGGQTIVSVMKARAAAPDGLVDLARLEELKGIELGSDGSLELGAMTTLAEIGASPEARARPILPEVCAQIADTQVRNRGTVGGNICANDPTNHLPPLMVALGATMEITGLAGVRVVSAEEFFLGVYMTAVGQGELLTKVRLPPGRRDGFASVTIGVEGTCLVSAVATLDSEPRIAIGCVGAVPYRPRALEAQLGDGLDLQQARAAARGLGAELDPPSDVHGSADYRRAIAEVVVARAVAQASERGHR